MRSRGLPVSDVSEEIVRSWLMSRGYFVLQGVRFKGQGELDFLAVRFEGDKVEERWHVEVNMSANPVTSLGQKQAGEGTDPKQGVESYIERKFLQAKTIKAVANVFGTENYRRMLVLGNVNNESTVLRACNRASITVVRTWKVLREVRQRRGRWLTSEGRRFSEFLQLAKQGRNVPKFK